MAPSISPARAAAFDVIRRVFEDEAYADRALADGDRRRSTTATARSPGSSRTAPCSAPARSTTRSRRSGGGRSRRLDAAVRAALRLGAYQLVFLDGVPRYAAVNESVELVRRARLERAVPFTNAVLRRLADEGRAAGRGAAGLDAGRRPPSRTPIRTGWPRRGGATSAPDGALALMRAQNEAPATVVRLVRGEIDGVPDPDVPGAWHVEHVDETAFAEGRIWPQSAGSQLAGLAVGSRRGRAGARPLRRAGRQGDDARRRGRRRRGERRARARARGERRAASARRTSSVVCADGRELPAELTGFDRALVDAPCSGLGVLAARPDLRWRSQPLPELQLELLQRRRRARPPGRHRRLLRLHGQPRRGARRSSTPRGSRSTTSLAAAWPRFRHPTRPEFLQTLPHVHGTSGFFIARLRA